MPKKPTISSFSGKKTIDKNSLKRIASLTKRLANKGYSLEKAYRMNNRRLKKVLKKKKAIADNTIEAYRKLIRQAIGNKDRRERVYQEIEKDYAKQITDVVDLTDRLEGVFNTINKVYDDSKNAKFMDIVNDLVEEFGYDRDDAIKEAQELLRLPVDEDIIQQLIDDGKITYEEIELLRDKYKDKWEELLQQLVG